MKFKSNWLCHRIGCFSSLTKPAIHAANLLVHFALNSQGNYDVKRPGVLFYIILKVREFTFQVTCWWNCNTVNNGYVPWPSNRQKTSFPELYYIAEKRSNRCLSLISKTTHISYQLSWDCYCLQWIPATIPYRQHEKDLQNTKNTLKKFPHVKAFVPNEKPPR